MAVQNNTFYFIHKIKLQTLPYVQKQVTGFIKYFQNHLNNKSHCHTLQETQKWQQRTKIIFLMLERKLKHIEQFHYDNWMDYRANLVLRSKKLLVEFYQQNKNLFQFLSEENVKIVEIKVNDIEGQNDGGIQQEQVNDIQKEDDTYEKIKESVKRIKTEMVEKQNKPKITTKKVQTKKGKTPTVNISKQEINKEISKILDKSADKSKTNLVFASRRVQQKPQTSKKEKSVNQGNNNLSKSKNNLESRLGGSIEKSINNSKQKSVNRSKEKSMSKNQSFHKASTLKKVEKVKKSKEQDQQKQSKKAPATKNMTKQEYIQYLINKNKMTISGTKF